MRNIDWNKWSAIAEILGAIAIIVTLVYLSLQTNYLAEQTRQNNEFLRADALYRIYEHRQTLIGAIIHDETLAEALIAANSDPDRLTTVQRRRLEQLYLRTYSGMSLEFLQFQDGLLEDYPYPFEVVQGIFMQNEISRAIWCDRYLPDVRITNPAFHDFVISNGLTDFCQ